MRPKKRRTLEQILASTSEVLFPAEMGEKVITTSTTDCDGDTPLHVLARRGDIHAVRTLLKAGANPNAQGDMSETPLHIAVAQGHREIASLLLEHGANPEIVCEFGDSSLERAEKKGSGFVRLFNDARL